MGGDISEWSARRATRHYDERDLSHESSQSSTIFANSLNQIKSKHKKRKKEKEKTKIKHFDWENKPSEELCEKET